MSFNFPPGYIVGTVADKKLDDATGMYILKVQTAANFYNLQQVHIIVNLEYDEQIKLNQDTKKNVEDPKKAVK